MGTIDNNTNIEATLQEKLKASNLSEKEIKEIIPEILKLTNKIKEDVENSQTETTTKNFLLDLRQDVTNNSNVSIDIKRNKWTVIWTIELNNITNNFYVINKSNFQAQPKAQPEKNLSNSQSRIQQKAQPEATSNTKPETVSSSQPIIQQKVQPETVSSTQPDQININLDSHEWYDKALSQLIFEIDWCISTAKYKRWLNKSWKETLKTAKAKLKQYKDIISDKKRMLEHELKAKNKLNEKNPDKAPLSVSISTAEINELKNRRFQRKQKIEIDIKEWQNGKSSNLAPWPNQSQEQIAKWNKVDIHHIEYDSRLNEALQDAAFLRIIDNNQDRAREFLQAIANNSLSDAQITICQSRMVQLAPYFEQYGLTNQVHRCIQTRWWRYNQSIQVYWNVDWKTAYKLWWITGWLNHELIKRFPNVTPQQASNISNIAVAAGWIYAIYRIWKRFFGKNKEWKRNLWWKAAGLASIYFVPQLLLWKDWYSLLWDILTWKADFWELWYRASNCLRFMNNNSPELYAQMAPWVLWMSIFPQTYTVDNVKALQQTFSDQNTRKQRYTATYNRLNKNNSALANEFRNTFNQNQYNEAEWNVFLAKLWITDKTNWNTIIFNEAAKIADKKTSFELWMKSQWKEKNPEFKQEINNYLKQEWEFNPKDLNPNWFKNNKDAKYTLREEDFQNKEKLTNQVENLPLNSQEKSELKSALEEFYDRRTLESKPNPNDFNLEFENWLLILTSQSWQKAKIDINKKELVWFWNWIRYSDFSDLLNTADIANKILASQKWKSANMPPFQYKPWWRWIYFNNANSIIQDVITWNNSWMDTRVLTSWILWGNKVGSAVETFLWLWWATSKVENLYNHPQDFADYLSKRRLNENKIDINPTLYPTIKSLSDSWINFINEQEVQQAEIRLKKVREMRCTANWWPVWYLPFSIEWNILVFSNVNGTKQYFPEHFPEDFPGKFQNLSSFPTLLREKDKFLAFMNDKNNWMRASALNR